MCLCFKLFTKLFSFFVDFLSEEHQYLKQITRIKDCESHQTRVFQGKRRQINSIHKKICIFI